MKSELKEISPTQRQITIEVDATSLKEAYGRVSQKYAKGANVPGFRKGYAPLDVVRLRFKEEIKNEVLQEVLPGKISEAIMEHQLQPLTEPHLHLEDPANIKVNGSEPLSLDVHVEVMPEVPTPKYEGIEVTRRVRPVEDSEVDELINERLQKEAALIPVEGRKSEIGDTVIADLEGKFDDDPEGDPIKADDLEVKLGDQKIESSFTDNLAGVEVDEDKEFTISYPSDFSSSALAGKTVHYKAKIKSVGREETPELNDDWAKSLDEGYESLADLRKKLRADLETYSKADADARLRNEAITKLIEENSFEVPNTLIENQARNLLNNFARDLQQRGMDLKSVGEDFVQSMYGQMRQQAERDVRGAMLLEKIGEMENVEVSDDEVNEEVSKIAEYYRSTPEEIRESLEKQGGGMDNIRNNLRTRKTVEAIVAKAKIEDGEWVDPNAPQPVVEEEGRTEKKKSAKKKTESDEEKKPVKKTARKKTTGE